MTNTMSTNGMNKHSHDADIEVLQSEVLSSFCNLLHFISTRKGGVSQGKYASLNLAYHCGDKKELVDENIKRLCEKLHITPTSLVAPNQVHGDRVAIIDNSFLQLTTDEQAAFLNETDALITDTPGICISIATADCVPILVYAPDKQVVAAIHAGWRGTVAHIAAKTIERMVKRFDCDPNLMRCLIGPYISQEMFEVGEEVVEAFKQSDIDLSKHGERNNETGKMHIHLGSVNRNQLTDAHIPLAQIELTDLCSFKRSDLFFSARREGIESGRMLSGICLLEKH